MSFDYTRILADYSAAFPSSAVTPLEVKNLDDNGYAISGEAFTVPASPDGDGLYRVNLDQIPLEQSSVTITVNSGARTVVPINEAPSAGQVALSTADGSMIFNSADAGLTGAATYTGRGTPIMAHHFHLLQKELAAVEGWLLGNGLLDEVMAGIDGVDATTFTLDSDNAGAGASAVTLAFNRGTDGGDARLVWNETSDRFEFSVTGAGTALDLWMGNLLAVDGTFSGDLDCNNATGTGNFVRANSPTLVTPSLGVASATSITTGGLSVNGDAAVTGEIDAGSIALDGTEIVDASRNLDNIANVTGTGDFVRATSPTLVTPNIGAATGTSAAFSGDVTLSGNSRRLNLTGWTGTNGQEGRIVTNSNGDADNWMGEITTDAIGFVIGGNTIAGWYSSAIRTFRPFRSNNLGSASAPIYSYWNDSNTGMYSSGADALDFTTGGTRAGGFNSSQQLEIVGSRITFGGIPIICGSGSPETAVTAPVGSLFLRTDGGASTTLYVKESGTGNTGWAAK